MPKRTSKSGSELFIVDNSDEKWKVREYLTEWCSVCGSPTKRRRLLWWPPARNASFAEVKW